MRTRDDRYRPVLNHPRRQPPDPANEERDGVIRCRLALVIVTELAALLTAATLAAGSNYPRPPRWWITQAACIHSHEGAWHEKSNPSQRGGLQIAWSTWVSVGGTGDPADATVREQLYRGWLIYLQNGSRWGGNQWPNTSRMCGLR